ncbi:MAG: hypothetical protein C0469_00165 [Cyanobacteria bacterium DS2.3.42]|nr:hypothetical protein [Cyanobacteria bacterium DS2.3.42]
MSKEFGMVGNPENTGGNAVNSSERCEGMQQLSSDVLSSTIAERLNQNWTKMVSGDTNAATELAQFMTLAPRYGDYKLGLEIVQKTNPIVSAMLRQAMISRDSISLR